MTEQTASEMLKDLDSTPIAERPQEKTVPISDTAEIRVKENPEYTTVSIRVWRTINGKTFPGKSGMTMDRATAGKVGAAIVELLKS